jgi:hypothetical protein
LIKKDSEGENVDWALMALLGSVLPVSNVGRAVGEE